ncbi:MAG TPA: alkaline phosphatase family protein [Chloroflexota bacterium]
MTVRRPAIGLFVLSLLIGLPPSGAGGTPAPVPRYAVVIVLDGARPDYFNLAAMPHLRALMRRGVTYTQAFVGQELANTPPSHATIGTGMLPKHHGVEGFLWEDPQTHLMTNPTETWSVEAGALERVIAAHHVPSLASQIKAAHHGARIASVAAHKCYASDAMGTPSSDYILCALIYHNRWVAQAIGSHRPPPGAINNPQWDVPIPSRTSGFGPAVQQWRVGGENAWTVRYAFWAFHRVRYPRVLMMNLSETDVLGHFASNDEIARALMQQFDWLLGRIIAAYRAAGLLDRTDFVVTADHGMSRIDSVVPYSVLSRSVVLARTTPVYIEHDTAAAIGIADDARARAVALNIVRLGGRSVDAAFYKVLQGGRWMYYLAAAQPGLPTPLLHAYRRLADTMAAGAGPDVFAVFAPNTSSRQAVAYGYTWKAGHLGPQWGDQHIPLIISGPGVTQGKQSVYPARLVDIAPTVEHLLGARTGPIDGIVLADALQQPTTEEVREQRGRRAILTPVVETLEHRSGYR